MSDWATAGPGFRIARVARDGRRYLGRVIREMSRSKNRMVTLVPDEPARGNVLLGYILEGFHEGEGSALCRSHTQYWESMEIARAWRDLGYRVDVFGNYDYRFDPPRTYDVFIGARMILERVGERINDDCVKVLHIDAAHWLFHREAQYRRLASLKERRGVALLPRKTLESNRAIEYADCATMLGNDFTESTYAYAGTPIHRVPLSTVATFPWSPRRDFEACRRRFLWLGGTALVHKGLDRVLEAFADMPDYHLTVCGPLDEEDFCSAYREELFDTPNIDAVGWTDVESAEFRQIRENHLALVFPTCSEAQSGGVVTCMHAGLIPVVSRQSGVDVSSDVGVVLRDCSVEAIRAAVSELASRPVGSLEDMARRAWRFARENHTRERFASEYRRAARSIAVAHGLPMGDRGRTEEGGEVGSAAGAWRGEAPCPEPSRT